VAGSQSQGPRTNPGGAEYDVDGPITWVAASGVRMGARRLVGQRGAPEASGANTGPTPGPWKPSRYRREFG